MRLAPLLWVVALQACVHAGDAKSDLTPFEPPYTREGFIQVPGGQVWYRVVGDGPGTPLLVLNGGPGTPSDYLWSLSALANERPVVFYDQLGCGRSDRPTDTSLWTLERYVEELAAVRTALGLREVHLLGHSWGTMLAVEYLLSKPPGVRSVTFASPVMSVQKWQEDQERQRAALPADVQSALARHEAAGTVNDPEYRAAYKVYIKRHVCRMDPWPAPLLQSMKNNLGEQPYLVLWGPNERMPTGPLKTFERVARLGELDLPSLFTCGTYDEASPQTVEGYRKALPGSRLVVFENSAHIAHLEERERYNAVLRDFLAGVDRSKR